MASSSPSSARPAAASRRCSTSPPACFTPSAGRVAIFGDALAGLNRQAGYLFQAGCAVSVEDRAATMSRSAWRSPARRATRRARARRNGSTRVGLGAFGDRYPHMLSGGQRKRVGLAQVLIRDPKILLMDEPFGPLDAQTRQIMGNLLLELWSADRKAVLFVTHDLEEAIALVRPRGDHVGRTAARIIGDWRVPLARPRDIAEVKLDPAFHSAAPRDLAGLKAEVMKGYAQIRGALASAGAGTSARYKEHQQNQGGMSCRKFDSRGRCVGVLRLARAPTRRACSRCRRRTSRTASGWRPRWPATTSPIRTASARTCRRQLSWANPPGRHQRATSLLMFDPEGRPPGGVSHWVAYGIPAIGHRLCPG